MPTTTTKTIGSTGDYSTLQAWEDACPANLVTADEIWRGECQNQTFSSSSRLLTVSGQTTDATRYIVLSTASGASFADNANKLTNALRYNESNGAAISFTGFYDHGVVVSTPYTVIEKLQIKTTQLSSYSGITFDGASCLASQLLVQYAGSGNGSPGIGMANGGVARNCISHTSSTVTYSPGFKALNGTVSFYNCLAIIPSNIGSAGGVAFQTSYSSAVVQNCAGLGQAAFSGSYGGSPSFTGNNNASTTTISFGTSNQASLTFADQIEEPDATTGLDCRTKAGAALIDNGADLSGSGVTTDIVGTARGATYDIGVWEYAAAGVTVALTGTAATAAVGTLGVSRTTAITGVAGTSAAGTIAPSLALALTGVEGIAAVGAVGIGGDKTVALTGVEATGEVGDVAVAVPSGAAGQSRTRRGARRVYLPEPQATAVFHPNALPEELAPHAVKAWQDDEDDEWFLLA